MKIEEFNIETKKLERFYEKEIPDEQKRIWYDEFKKINVERYRYIISIAYKKNRFLPKLADMIEINRECKYVEKAQENATGFCQKCRGTGYIIYKKKNKDTETDYTYGCRCTCVTGMQKPKNIPTWQEVGLKL